MRLLLEIPQSPLTSYVFCIEMACSTLLTDWLDTRDCASLHNFRSNLQTGPQSSAPQRFPPVDVDTMPYEVRGHESLQLAISIFPAGTHEYVHQLRTRRLTAYIHQCPHFQLNPSNEAAWALRLVDPISTPAIPFHDCFIEALPLAGSNQFDSILMITDKVKQYPINSNHGLIMSLQVPRS